MIETDIMGEMESEAQLHAGGPVLFGQYVLDEQIARGGMSVVYRARLRGLGGFEKRLIIKQILPELATDPRFVRMFVAEAKTLVQMNHPHIAPIYELGIVDGVYFLSMEEVNGATVAEILREGPLSPELVAHIGIQVCDALHYAHERFSLVHRDVTPRNIIVDSMGLARLLDFGIAAPVEVRGTGEVFGSHGYMSPEQALGESLQPQSDLFSLGCVLFEALTGKYAFWRGTITDSRVALLEREPPKLTGRGDVPAQLAAAVDSTLMGRPEQRPASAAALARTLRSWLAGVSPEGVGSELGARSERAHRKREQERLKERRPLEGSREPSHVIRSLATSRALEELLESHGNVVRPSSVRTRNPDQDALATARTLQPSLRWLRLGRVALLCLAGGAVLLVALAVFLWSG